MSLVGMDFARTFAVPHKRGSATGFVNMGGFISTIISVLLVGVVLQVVSPAGASTYTLGEYRIAFAALVVPLTIGVIGVYHQQAPHPRRHGGGRHPGAHHARGLAQEAGPLGVGRRSRRARRPPPGVPDARARGKLRRGATLRGSTPKRRRPARIDAAQKCRPTSSWQPLRQA